MRALTRRVGLSMIGAASLAGVLGGLTPTAQAAPGPRYGENFLLPPHSTVRGRDVPALAVDPADQNHIVESEIDPVNFQCDYNASFDGGRTWTGGHLTARDSGENPPFPTPACSQNFDSGGYAHMNNASIAYGSGQNVYITFSAHRGDFNRPERTITDGGNGDDALVAHSTDGGRTFQPAVIAVPGGGPVLPAQGGLAGFGMRPQVGVQRGAGAGGQDRIYVSSWNCFIRVRASQTSRGGCLFGGGDRRIFVARSDDGGATWIAPVLASAAAVRTGGAIAEAGSPDEQALEPSQPVVGPDGAVYVAYRNRDITDGVTCPPNPFPIPAEGGFPASRANCIVIAKSTDMGATWTRRNTGVSLRDRGQRAQPRLALDPASGGSGSLYVTFALRPGTPAMPGTDLGDVVIQRSSDGGATFTQNPVRVNDDPAGNGQSFPQVSVGAGRVDVTWLDRRNRYPGPGGVNIADIYTARSSDDGASFAANRRVTDRSFSLDVGLSRVLGSYNFYGPVSQTLADGSRLTAWMDSRTGNVDNGVQDVFLSRLEPNAEIGASTIATATPPGLSVRLSRLAYPGGGEGDASSLDPVTRLVVANEGDVGGALAGAVLARANRGSLLLSSAGGLPPIVKAEATRMRPVGAYVIGNTNSLSSAVSSDLRDATRGGENVTRISSPSSVPTVDRPAEVARQIAERMRPLPGASPEAVIVNPGSPEAVSAAALAAALELPILFADTRSGTPGPTTAAIKSLGIKKVLIVGSSGSVSPGVQADLNTSLGAGNVTRIEGADQYETSQAVLTEARRRGLPANVVYVADGSRPIDATVLGAAVGRLNGLMLLTPSASTAAAQSRLTTLGLDPLVDRVVAAIGTGGTDPTLPAPPTPPGTPPVAPAPPPRPGVIAPGVTPPVTTRRKGRFSARVTKADFRAPYRFRTTGRLTLPTGIAKSVGCTGRVSVQVKRGSVTLSTRRVSLRKDCTFASTVIFGNASRFRRSKRLKFTARFLGNRRVARAQAPPQFARVRR